MDFIRALKKRARENFTNNVRVHISRLKNHQCTQMLFLQSQITILFNENAIQHEHENATLRPSCSVRTAPNDNYNTKGEHHILKGARYLFKTVKHQWKDGWFRTFSFGWSEGTSTSKAVACAVISIAGSVTTQPTAQTTTSASTWPKKAGTKEE